jgi:hypothetical protein
VVELQAQLHQILETLEDRAEVLLFITYLLLVVVAVEATIQLMVEVEALVEAVHIKPLKEAVEVGLLDKELQGQQELEMRQLVLVEVLEMQAL